MTDRLSEIEAASHCALHKTHRYSCSSCQDAAIVALRKAGKALQSDLANAQALNRHTKSCCSKVLVLEADNARLTRELAEAEGRMQKWLLHDGQLEKERDAARSERDAIKKEMSIGIAHYCNYRIEADEARAEADALRAALNHAGELLLRVRWASGNWMIDKFSAEAVPILEREIAPLIPLHTLSRPSQARWECSDHPGHFIRSCCGQCDTSAHLTSCKGTPLAGAEAGARRTDPAGAIPVGEAAVGKQTPGAPAKPASGSYHWHDSDTVGGEKWICGLRDCVSPRCEPPAAATPEARECAGKRVRKRNGDFKSVHCPACPSRRSVPE